MKRNLWIFFIIAVVSQSCSSEDLGINSTRLNKEIENYITLYSNKIYETKEAGIFGYSPEGGMITADFDEDRNVIFFEAYLFFETGKIKYECYFVEDNIKRFVKTKYRYDMPISESDSKIISEEEEKMIILDNNIYIFDTNANEYQDFDNDRYIPMISEFLEIIDNDGH